MASVSTEGSRRQQKSPARPRPSRRGKPRRWLKWTVLGMTLLAVLVFVAPIIVAKTSLRSAPLRIALEGISGTVQAGGATLSWFGPIEYRDIEVRDNEGELLVSLGKVCTERTLAGLIVDSSDIGVVRVERPELLLALRSDGSNAEDVLMPWLEKLLAEPSTGPNPNLTLEITGGSVIVSDAVTNELAELDELNFKLSLSPASSLPTDIALSGKALHNGRTSALSIESEHGDAGQLDGFEAKINGLPLAMLRPVLHRVDPGLQLAGTISTDLRCAGIGGLLAEEATADGLQVSGTVAAEDIFAAGGWLGDDRLSMSRIDVPCRAQIRNGQLDVEQLAVVCDVGEATAAGAVPLADLKGAGPLEKIVRSTLDVRGEVDLAKLAALLPKTLHVRPGTQITSGMVQCSFTAKPAADGHAWSGQLAVSNLAASDQGRELSWQRPIDLHFAAREDGGAISVDELKCVSDFMNLAASGSMSDLSAQASVDLNRLTSELGQFVDMGSMRLAGQGTANLNWRWTRSTGECNGAAQFSFQSLEILLPGQPPWMEESVTGSANVAASAERAAEESVSLPTLKRIDSAQLQAMVIGGGAREQVDVRLTAPVDLAASQPSWSVEGNLQAQLARWWPRIGPWLGVDGLALGGACSMAGHAVYSPAGIQLQQVRANINQLHAWGWNSFFIDEPMVQCDLSGGYEFASGTLQLGKTTLLTSTVSLLTEEATIALAGPQGASMDGTLSYQADLGRLVRWLSNPQTPPSYALAGRMIGSAQFTHAGSVSDGGIDATVDQFAVYVLDPPAARARVPAPGNAAPAPEPVWTEEKLSLAVRGGLDGAADRLQLSSLNVGSKAFQMQAAGTVAKLSTRKDVDLAGKVTYNWRTLSALLRPYLGRKVRIVGRRTDNFALRGPLGAGSRGAGPRVQLTAAERRAGSSAANEFAFLKPMTANAALGWTSADVYGMPIGPLTIDAELQNGLLTTRPIEATVGQAPGKLALSPTLRFSPGPAELVLGKGRVLSDVQVSQELSNSWLKFVVPWVAAATRTEGTFSLDIDAARVPVDFPHRAQVTGTLIVQNLEVTAGPLVRPLALIGKQVEAILKNRIPPQTLDRDPGLLQIKKQNVKFRMADGRIYNEGLTMIIGTTPVRTYGWVGIDESVDLTVEVAAKNDRVIKIPIRGTLGRLEWEPGTLLRLVPQTLENATRGLLEGELNKQLEKLFQGPQR